MNTKLFLFFLILFSLNLIMAGECYTGIEYCNPNIPFQNSQQVVVGTTFNNNTAFVNNSYYLQGYTPQQVANLYVETDTKSLGAINGNLTSWTTTFNSTYNGIINNNSYINNMTNVAYTNQTNNFSGTNQIINQTLRIFGKYIKADTSNAIEVYSNNNKVFWINPNASNYPIGSSGGVKVVIGDASTNGEFDFYNYRAIGGEDTYNMSMYTKGSGSTFKRRLIFTGNQDVGIARFQNAFIQAEDTSGNALVQMGDNVFTASIYAIAQGGLRLTPNGYSYPEQGLMTEGDILETNINSPQLGYRDTTKWGVSFHEDARTNEDNSSTYGIFHIYTYEPITSTEWLPFQITDDNLINLGVGTLQNTKIATTYIRGKDVPDASSDDYPTLAIQQAGGAYTQQAHLTDWMDTAGSIGTWVDKDLNFHTNLGVYANTLYSDTLDSETIGKSLISSSVGWTLGVDGSNTKSNYLTLTNWASNPVGLRTYNFNNKTYPSIEMLSEINGNNYILSQASQLNSTTNRMSGVAPLIITGYLNVSCWGQPACSNRNVNQTRGSNITINFTNMLFDVNRTFIINSSNTTINSNVTINGNTTINGNNTINGNLNQTNGNATINNIYGEMYCKNDTGCGVIDLTTADVYVAMKNQTAGSLNGFKLTGATNLTAQFSGLYQANAKVSVTGGVPAGQFGMKIYINDTGQDNCYDHFEVGADHISMVISCFVRVNAGSNISIRFDDHASPVTDISFYASNLNLIRIGN